MQGPVVTAPKGSVGLIAKSTASECCRPPGGGAPPLACVVDLPTQLSRQLVFTLAQLVLTPQTFLVQGALRTSNTDSGW